MIYSYFFVHIFFLFCVTLVVKMMVWLPYSLAVAAPIRRKFQVIIKPLKLELEGLDHDFWREKTMMVRIKWKGEGNKFGQIFVPFSYRSRKNRDVSSERSLEIGKSWIQWENDEFENFIVICGGERWDVSFSILYGEAQGKKVAVGKGYLKLAELASNMELQTEKKIHLKLKAAEVHTEAALSVLVSLVEIRNSQDPTELMSSYTPQLQAGQTKNLKQKRPSQEELSFNDRGEPARFYSPTLKSSLSVSSGTHLYQVKKLPLFSWKRLKARVQSLNNNKTGEYGDRARVDQKLIDLSDLNSDTSSSKQVNEDTSASPKTEYERQNLTAGQWDEMELVSRDGQTKLKAEVFLASLDQCSDKAAGKSACTALVAVISHWLHLIQDRMPTGTEFDDLIIDGSSEWRKLSDNESLVNNFPDKHFDLETVLQAAIRPVRVAQDKSFVGFFSPEKFESLKGAMSFDEMWNEISKAEENQSRIYIVSWNDHFFVFKVDDEAYYIIDTLGERLFEGCKQAFILKFDKATVMLGMEKENFHDKETVDTEYPNSKEGEEVICKGKDCCREFIKRFLAAIPLKELELKEEKETVSYYSLHQRLQIEFNFSTSYSLLSPSISSVSSDAAVSISSLFSNETDSD